MHCVVAPLWREFYILRCGSFMDRRIYTVLWLLSREI
jgi:hypothetical protein